MSNERYEKTVPVAEPVKGWFSNFDELMRQRAELERDPAHRSELRAQEERRAWLERENRRPLWADRGVLPKDLDMLLAGTFRQSQALSVARQFQESLWLILVLSSPADAITLADGTRLSGFGKTFAAEWIVTQADPGRFLHVRELERANKFSGEEMEALERVPLLALDDLGVENIGRTGEILGRIDSLLDARYGRRRKTVVTTNLTKAAFAKRYGDRVARRIEEAGLFVDLDPHWRAA